MVNIRLNPCFSGRWSARRRRSGSATRFLSLNPCFSGRWSARFEIYSFQQRNIKVLILVLVEDGLREEYERRETRRFRKVLILVLVEDCLRVDRIIVLHDKKIVVLILVLVEDCLREESDENE